MKTFTVYSILLCFFSGFLSGVPARQYSPDIFINEFMASNATTIYSSDYHEFSDWIELYNGSDTIINVGGFYLTDDLQEPFKWQIPVDTKVRPGWAILFWADGRNEGRHTNFNLDKNGEAIGLYTAEGQLVDSVHYAEQLTDISYGRYPDGSDSWFFFDVPTPVASNSSSGYNGRCPAPNFDPEQGFYQKSLSIKLKTNHVDETIVYTRDGSVPDEHSAVYSEPIWIDQTTVIRARTIKKDYLPSKVVTQTFFIDETTTLPIVSVATNPANLWDDETGIYVEGTNGITDYCSKEPKNWNQPWEKPVSMEFYETDRTQGFVIDAGMQIGGGCTRLYPQKTLAFYARSEYGFSKIEYPVFADKSIDSYNNLILRNGGQDWWRAIIRDGMVHTLVKDMMDIDWQAYKPAVLYLNGYYWGIHGIREKHNEHYLESNYGIDPDAVDILTGNAMVKEGSADNYVNMLDFIETHDMKSQENYKWVAARMDINEYLNYVITEIYAGNIDWPGGNIKYWRPHGENHKWRWILYDVDLSFGAHSRGQYDSNTLANATAESQSYYANPPWSTFLLRRLLENDIFRNRFIQKFASHLNITFEPERVLEIIDSLKTIIEAEIPRHTQKWEESTSFNDGWSYHLRVMKEFASKRPEFMIDHLKEKFELRGTAKLLVHFDHPERGTVFINNVKLPTNRFKGTYFKDISIECRAVPDYGYRFAGWRGISNAGNDSISIHLTKDSTIQAIFEIDQSENFQGLRINEILALNEQTNSDEYGEYDDWIELFNDFPQAVDVGGLYLTDNLNQPDLWQIPSGFPDSTTIEPGGFILLWADNDPEQGIRHLDFRLNGDGEEVGLATLTDSGMFYIDTMSFGSQSSDISFGRSPDGAFNLQFFSVPTPGESNGLTGIPDHPGSIPKINRLYQNYANPFNASTVISYILKTGSKVSLSIYDVAGRHIKTLVSRYQPAGKYSVTFNSEHIPSGVYIYTLKTNYFRSSRKMILLR